MLRCWLISLDGMLPSQVFVHGCNRTMVSELLAAESAANFTLGLAIASALAAEDLLEVPPASSLLPLTA